MENLTELQLRKLLEELLRLSQCTVCKETLIPPVKTCSKGHFICFCHEYTVCPTCNECFENVELSIVTNWLKELPNIEENLAERDLRKLMKNLVMMSQCKFCKNLLSAPVRSCRQGHFVCCNHKKHRVPVCPTCNDSFTSLELPIVSNWLKQLSGQRDCKIELCASNVKKEPLCFDGWTYNYCPLCMRLKRRFILHEDIIDHLKTTHEEHDLGIFIKGHWKLNEEWTKMKKWNVFGDNLSYPFFINNSIFFLHTRKSGDLIFTHVNCWPTKESDFNYSYVVKYKNGDTEYSYTGKIFDERLAISDNDHFLALPVSALPLLTVDNTLYFEFKVVKFENGITNGTSE